MLLFSLAGILCFPSCWAQMSLKCSWLYPHLLLHLPLIMRSGSFPCMITWALFSWKLQEKEICCSSLGVHGVPLCWPSGPDFPFPHSLAPDFAFSHLCACDPSNHAGFPSGVAVNGLIVSQTSFCLLYCWRFCLDTVHFSCCLWSLRKSPQTVMVSLFFLLTP